MNLIRSFISLNIESSLQIELKKIQDDVKDKLKNQSIKWENYNKFHLTLRFLGDVEPERLNEISMELKQIPFGFDSIKMRVNTIGFFPNLKYPNVVFIGLAEDGNNSEVLVNRIDEELNKFGFTPDKKFVPHITIGRFRREKRKRLETGISYNVNNIEIKFYSYYLMKSTLKPGGSVYETINEYRFK